MLPKIGIIGHGFVGLAIETGFQSIADIFVYDRYKASESLDSVVNNSDILFICVPTPVDDEGYCDISIVESVASDILRVAEERKVIVIKSTVIPGTTEELASCYKDHSWIFNPEFLTEKNFINDFLEQNRIILGEAKNCSQIDTLKVTHLYEAFIKTQKNPGRVYWCTSTTAEVIKYANNCFLATKVMYFNEIAELCKTMEINYETVRSLVGLDKRIGTSHTEVPGQDGLRGFGGACFPKDIQALITLMEDYDLDPLILNSVWSKNLLIREKEDWREIKGATTEYTYET